MPRAGPVAQQLLAATQSFFRRLNFRQFRSIFGDAVRIPAIDSILSPRSFPGENLPGHGEDTSPLFSFLVLGTG
jgi:hypothetical protein